MARACKLHLCFHAKDAIAKKKEMKEDEVVGGLPLNSNIHAQSVPGSRRIVAPLGAIGCAVVEM